MFYAGIFGFLAGGLSPLPGFGVGNGLFEYRTTLLREVIILFFSLQKHASSEHPAAA